MITRARYALFGVLSALAGVGAGHLVAALTEPAASPEIAVGETVIDHTPTPLKNWAIVHFGTHDKAILVGSVLVVVLLLAAVAGLLARRAYRYGAGLLLVLTALALAAVLTRPVVHPVDALPGLVTAVVGLVSLWSLTRLDAGAPVLHGGDRSGATTGAGSASPSRRGVLIGAGAVTLIAAGTSVLGRAITRSRTALSAFALPKPTSPAPAFPVGLDAKVPGITPFRTSNADFYRVDTRLALPIVDASSWRLQITGDVSRAQSFSYDDLLAMPMIERDVTLACVSNEVGGPYISGARWLGVPLKTLLDKADISSSKADQILSTDVDGMTLSTPLALATDGRDAMIAVGMNGGPLPRGHGFPARMVVPGLYGFISACKWITTMELTTYDAAKPAYWTERGWAEHAPIKLESRIDTPQGLSRIRAGRTFIGGIAWAQPIGVAGVEVRVDGGPWQEAILGPSAGNDYWRQWYLPWDATSGRHQLACRTTDSESNVQTSARANPFPDGATGVEQILVDVA